MTGPGGDKRRASSPGCETGAPLPPRAPSRAAEVFRGALAMIGLRFALRLVGFVSVAVTARVLTPTDFGVMGTVAIVTGLFAILQQIGLSEGLTRLREVRAEHVNTAWTLNLLVSAAVAGALLLAAPLAARLLAEPQLTSALRHLAFAPVLVALQSAGSMLLLRELRFGEEFQLRVAQKLLMAGCTVAGALLLRSWWGLVYGTLAGASLGAAASYWLCPHRPALALSRAGDFLGFSFWTLVQALAVYVANFADEVAARRVSDTATFGLYHTSRDLSRTLVSEAVAPASQALLPGLAPLRDERARFARAAAQAVGAGAIVAVACGLGVSATAPEVTGLLLGPQWAGAAPFLALVAVGNIGQTLSGMHRGVLAAIDRTRVSALLWVNRAVVVALGAALAGWLGGGALGVAATYAALSLLLALFDYALVFRLLGRPRAVREVFARPAAAGAAMALALALLPLAPEGAPLALAALAKVAAGAAVYTAALLGLWWAAGRPDGAETALLHRLPGPFGRWLLPWRGAPPMTGRW